MSRSWAERSLTTQKRCILLPQNPTYYLDNQARFTSDLVNGASDIEPRWRFFTGLSSASAFYAQDSWHASASMTLNYGLRYFDHLWLAQWR